MMQLDDDILEAMKKFEQMEEVLNSLPGWIAVPAARQTASALRKILFRVRRRK